MGERMARKKKVSKYVELFDETLKLVNKQDKPTLLLQACCAPCSSAVLELLSEHFKITLFFNGHNIYPYAEYEKRLTEVKRLVEIAIHDFNAEIDLVVINPQIDDYTNKLAFGKDMKENSVRCQVCYSMRLKETLDYAKAHHFDYVTTVMTISRQKCSEKINTVAEKLMNLYPDLTYVYSDFKKRGGNTRSSELCKEYNLYQQQYCGCLYSLEDKIRRDKEKEIDE